MAQIEAIGAGGKDEGFRRAVHFRISEAESQQLTAYAARLAEERHAKVSISEAVRDLVAKGLRQGQKPWEVALRSLPFVAWRGEKPRLVRPRDDSNLPPLSSIVLEDRKDRL